MKNNQTLLVLDGQRFFIEGSQWQLVDHDVETSALIAECDDLQIISDFGVSPDARYVNGDSRYAEQLLQRDLRETGEALGSRKVIVHRKHKQDRFNSHLFYSILNNSDFTGLMSSVEASPSDPIPFSFYQNYAKAIDRYASKGSDAFVFIHGGVVDVVITSQGHLEGFSSLTGASNTERGEGFLNGLVDLVSTQERIAKVKLDQLFLFDLLTPENDDKTWKERLSKLMGLEIRSVAEQNLSFDGKKYTSSIVPLFNALSINETLLKPIEKLQYQSKRWLPAVAAVLLVLNSVLLWKYVDNNGQKTLGQEQIVALEKKLSAQPVVKALKAVNYKPYLVGVENILKSSGHKNYQQFINELAEMSDIGNVVTYDWVSIDYPKDVTRDSGLRINLTGHIANGWDTPLNAFDKLTGKFSEAGYLLKDNAIDTTDDGLDFAFVMELSGL